LIKAGVTCIPKVLGEGYFGENPTIKSEYADYSVEEYLKDTKIIDKIEFQQILQQMV
jgi:hypothetical protein